MTNLTKINNMNILDLGCGKNKRFGSVGVDFSTRHNPDMVHNLNNYPYPFESNFADEVYLDNILEHLNEPMLVMQEVHRITKMEGLVKVIVPYFRSKWAFTDPTHKTFYTVDSFAYYDPDHEICKRYDYIDTRFKVLKIVFNEGLEKGSLLSRFIVWLANINPHRYETYLSHLYPLDQISFHLKKI